MSPGDSGNTVIKAGDGETKEGLSEEEVTGESQAVLCLGSPEELQESSA